MKKILVALCVGIFVFGIEILNVSETLAQETELKAVSFVPKDHPLTMMIPTWIERANAELKGMHRINYVGGPEVIPGFEQAEATRKNIVQLAFTPAAYYFALLPEADAISLSLYDFKKEREKGGVIDYLTERHKTINLMYLGTWSYDFFYFRVSKPVKGLEDLKGLRMRTAAKYDKMMLKLGMVPVTVQMGETYTALQRGVVDGFGWSVLGARELGWLEFCKYLIDIPFYIRQNLFILMNLDVWNKIPKEKQDRILDMTIKYEPEMKATFEKALEKEYQEWDKMGVKRIKFSPEDTKKFLDAASNAFWEDLEKKTPEGAKNMKRLLGY
jgi:TRAP-type transport system periplasmic protein